MAQWVRYVRWPGSIVAIEVESSVIVTLEGGSCDRFWHEAMKATKPESSTTATSHLTHWREPMRTSLLAIADRIGPSDPAPLSSGGRRNDDGAPDLNRDGGRGPRDCRCAPPRWPRRSRRSGPA